MVFNGTDEEADTPDAAYWSRDDSGTNKFSLGLWINVASAGTCVLLSKWSSGGGPGSAREWNYQLGSGKPELLLYDDSVQKQPRRPGATAVVANTWAFVVATYDSGGGATAADGINIYVDGALDNGSATNDASYVAMEDL